MSTRIKRTVLKNGKVVSTIKLTVPYGELEYETMVFPNEKDFLDIECKRYKTVEEAVAGHKQMVSKYGGASLLWRFLDGLIGLDD